MKKIVSLLSLCFLLLIPGCACDSEEKDGSVIEYDHYANGGVKETLEARILWKYSTSAFTKYQVAYTSYVCSNPSVNFTNVIYVELTNVGSKDDSVIRNISFSTIEVQDEGEFHVGLWGDYIYSFDNNIYEGVTNELLPKLQYMNYASISELAQKGYGNYKHIDDIDVDVITSGTVSASNVVSIVKAIFDYHLENQY